MKQTLLEIVQDILSSLGSDEVNSIDDTVEAMDVARIVRRAYCDISGSANLPEHYSLFELEASGTTARPVLMTLPTNVVSLDWVKYNSVLDGDTDAVFKDIPFQPLDEFLERTYKLQESLDDIASFDYTVGTSSLTFKYRTDQAPNYFTTYDDYTLIFDAYDVAVDSTLQKTKSLGYGLVESTFSLTDSYTPDLDTKQFNLLFHEAKSMAFEDLKQTTHAGSLRKARRHWIHKQVSDRGVVRQTGLDRAPDYGRK